MRRSAAFVWSFVWSFVLCLLCAASAANAQVSAYQWVTQGGRNNLIDSNAESCDASPFDRTTGVWASSGQGCYDRQGGLCSAAPGQTCDLQVVPKGRCTSGDLSAASSCVWPHGAGRCVGNPHVGCLSDAYAAAPIAANAVDGPSAMCAATGTPTCDMDVDPYGGPFAQSCQCDGENPAAANFETTVCGTAGGAFKAVCSDGDPERRSGGFGWALGYELNLGGGSAGLMFATLGPTVNGSATPTTSPRYPLENPPTLFDPQRTAGSINRPSGSDGSGAIREARTTDARTLATFSEPLGIRSLQSYGDSYWSDWTFESKVVSGTFAMHRILLPCSPPIGWSLDQTVTPGNYCSQAARDGLTFLWSRDLSPAEVAANPTCPPSCKKDFDLTTVEVETIQSVANLDRNAGVQLALQNGQGSAAGSGDAVGVSQLTLAVWLNAPDMRCRLGGWGNAPGFVGRCSDGPSACVPGDPTNGSPLCTALGQGNVCVACNGPINPANPDVTNGQPNALGLPPGYSTHGLPALDLVAGRRTGGIAGLTTIAILPLFLIQTTGTATAEFRDTPGAGVGSLDLADLGQVTGTFAPGIGTGGTFQNGTTLPIGAPCCANGLDIVWAPEAPGTAVTPLLRTFDVGPGPDGIPGCLGDVSLVTNGQNACNQRLGKGGIGPKTDGQFNTGLDDVPSTASHARFGVRDLAGGAPAYNQVSALAFRDADVFFIPDNLDGLWKVDVSHCPIVGGHARCEECADGDGDGVCDEFDDCPTVPDASQADADGDGVGDACDNCVGVPNPRVPGGSAVYLAANPWATLTGGQRDDDHDGYGNRCDADFPGTTQGGNVNPADTAQYKASVGRNRTTDTCGTSGSLPCAIFDLEPDGSAAIGPADTARFKLLLGSPAGPKCAACPLACEAGPDGSCL